MFVVEDITTLSKNYDPQLPGWRSKVSEDVLRFGTIIDPLMARVKGFIEVCLFPSLSYEEAAMCAANFWHQWNSPDGHGASRVIQNLPSSIIDDRIQNPSFQGFNGSNDGLKLDTRTIDDKTMESLAYSFKVFNTVSEQIQIDPVFQLAIGWKCYPRWLYQQCQQYGVDRVRAAILDTARNPKIQKRGIYLSTLLKSLN